MNREERLEYKRKWNKADRKRKRKAGECNLCSKKAVKGKRLCSDCGEKNRKHGKKRQRRETLKKYGLTQDQYVEMYEAQHGLCMICGSGRGCAGVDPSRPGGRDVLVVDHDHTTGQVRGLLCSRCNLIIGHIEEAGSLLDKMVEYTKGTV